MSAMPTGPGLKGKPLSVAAPRGKSSSTDTPKETIRFKRQNRSSQTFSVLSGESQADSGEDLAEGASFWHAFLTPFWGPETIVIFKRNYVEAMCGLSQIQDKPSKSFDQNQPDITFGKRSSPKHKRP